MLAERSTTNTMFSSSNYGEAPRIVSPTSHLYLTILPHPCQGWLVRKCCSGLRIWDKRTKSDKKKDEFDVHFLCSPGTTWTNNSDVSILYRGFCIKTPISLVTGRGRDLFTSPDNMLQALQNTRFWSICVNYNQEMEFRSNFVKLSHFSKLFYLIVSRGIMW